jgi:hypothetical protein
MLFLIHKDLEDALEWLAFSLTSLPGAVNGGFLDLPHEN